MKIGIDARMYGSKQGGLGRYIEQLIKHLEQTDSQNEYAVFLRKENWDEYNPSLSKGEHGAGKNFKKILADIPWYGFAEQLKLPKIIKKEKIDLMHFPHWNVPCFYSDPFILTLHDLILLHYPSRQASTLGFFAYLFKNLAFKIVLRRAIKKARHIIVPSEFTKQDLQKTLRLPPEKISVIYLAPHLPPRASTFNGTNSFDKIPLPILKKHNITKPYALYVGVAYPHKNLEGLIKAWKIFEGKYSQNHQLVLVGKRNYFYNRLLNNVAMKQCNPRSTSAKASGYGASNVIYTDYLNDAELAQIYSQSSLCVFPSFYEGFGMPPLEAMQYGIPVVSANSACLPEILGNAAFYFNPNNIEEIAQAVYKGFTDQNLRKQLIENSKNILRKYSWINTAKQTLEVYNNKIPLPFSLP